MMMIDDRKVAPAPLHGSLLDPMVNNAPTSSMFLGIMLHDDTATSLVWCNVLQIPRRDLSEIVSLSNYDVRFISSIVALGV